MVQKAGYSKGGGVNVEKREPLPLATKTPWGKICAMGFRDGERWYMMMNASKDVSLMPGSVVEATLAVKENK